MKIYKHKEPNYNELISDIFDDHIIGCKYIQHAKELEIMEQKCRHVCNNISFKDYSQELMFKDAFIKGYLAAFVVSDEEQKIINSITPLGIALEE
jgi:hypothetical protein